MPPTGFEIAIPASQRPHTHALDRAYTGIGERKVNKTIIYTIHIHELSEIYRLFKEVSRMIYLLRLYQGQYHFKYRNK
jgi:hypothetical protein